VRFRQRTTELHDNFFVKFAQEEISMKKLLLSAAAAAFLAAPAAVAQNSPNPSDDNQAKHEKADRQNTDQNGPNSSAMHGPAAQDRDRSATPGRDRDASAPPNNIMKVRPDNDRDNDVHKTVIHKTVTRTEVLKVRANIQAPHRFQLAAYRRPAGFYVHRWAFGERLPVAFYVRDYWIADFALYGLIEPWPGYEWIRVGDDALLVDIETGEVIRVEYGLFY
jgi:Ni/Co efflux regulator RcnB